MNRYSRMRILLCALAVSASTIGTFGSLVQAAPDNNNEWNQKPNPSVEIIPSNKATSILIIPQHNIQ
jgi:hypothetical protein